MVKIACQTIVFGNPSIRDNLEKYAGTVKKIGYDGIEVGVRHFCQDRVEYYREMFLKLNLELAAIHVGGDFLNKDSVKQQLLNMKNNISFGKKLGSTYVFLSGSFSETKTTGDYATEAESYKEIGRMCSGEGLVFCYHNHDWEFRYPKDGMKMLLDRVPADLMKLVPDVGWLEQAGVNALQFIKDNISRVEALHFKEYKKLSVSPRSEIDNEVTELGRGVVPFREIYDYVAGLNRDWWIVAEQDKALIAPEESARINYEYIKSLKGREK